MTNLDTIDDKGIIITNVTFHIFNTLFQFHIVMIPWYSASSQTENKKKHVNKLSILIKNVLNKICTNLIILQVNLALCPSKANVDWGLITNLGAAHLRSIKTSCILYFSIWSFLKDENSLNLPSGKTNSFQLAYFCLIFSRMAKNLLRAISRVLWL